ARPSHPGQNHPPSRAWRGGSHNLDRDHGPNAGADMNTSLPASPERPASGAREPPDGSNVESAVVPSGGSRPRVAKSLRLAVPRQGKYWLLAVVSLLGMGWLKGINLLLLLGYLMLGLWGLNFALAGRRLRRLQARRRIGGPVFAQMPCTVAIEVF